MSPAARLIVSLMSPVPLSGVPGAGVVRREGACPTVAAEFRCRECVGHRDAGDADRSRVAGHDRVRDRRARHRRVDAIVLGDGEVRAARIECLDVSEIDRMRPLERVEAIATVAIYRDDRKERVDDTTGSDVQCVAGSRSGAGRSAAVDVERGNVALGVMVNVSSPLEPLRAMSFGAPAASSGPAMMLSAPIPRFTVTAEAGLAKSTEGEVPLLLIRLMPSLATPLSPRVAGCWPRRS